MPDGPYNGHEDGTAADDIHQVQKVAENNAQSIALIITVITVL